MSTATRRRRAPEQAEREILDAAEALLRSGSLDQLTVSEVMRGTTLTRNAFYAYFTDRYDLVARLVDRVRGGADAAMATFVDQETSDPSAAGRAALRSAAQLWVGHGELLRALADAARRDPSAEQAWRQIAEPSERAVTEWIRTRQDAGQLLDLEPDPTARALVAMNRACFADQLAGRPDADVEALVDALHAIWARVLLAP